MYREEEVAQYFNGVIILVYDEKKNIKIKYYMFSADYAVYSIYH